VNNLAQNNGATGIDGNECDAAPFHFRIESNFDEFHGSDYAWLCRVERSTRSGQR
jgi:hypothetical protein